MLDAVRVSGLFLVILLVTTCAVDIPDSARVELVTQRLLADHVLSDVIH